MSVLPKKLGRRRVRAVLVGRRRRDRSAVDQRLAVGVDGRTHGGVAAVHPHRGGEGPGGHGVVVVAQELSRQAVGAGAAAIPDRPPVQGREGPHGAGGRSHRRGGRPPACAADRRWWSATGPGGRCRPGTHPDRRARSPRPGSWPDRSLQRRPPWRCSWRHRWSTRPPRPASFGGAEAVVGPGDHDLIGGVGPGGGAGGDVDAGEHRGPGAGHPVDGEAALDRVELADVSHRRHDHPRPLEVRPPLKDRAWKNTPWRVWMSVPTQTT